MVLSVTSKFTKINIKLIDSYEHGDEKDFLSTVLSTRIG